MYNWLDDCSVICRKGVFTMTAYSEFAISCCRKTMTFKQKKGVPFAFELPVTQCIKVTKSNGRLSNLKWYWVFLGRSVAAAEALFYRTVPEREINTANDYLLWGFIRFVNQGCFFAQKKMTYSHIPMKSTTRSEVLDEFGSAGWKYKEICGKSFNKARVVVLKF